MVLQPLCLNRTNLYVSPRRESNGDGASRSNLYVSQHIRDIQAKSRRRAQLLSVRCCHDRFRHFRFTHDTEADVVDRFVWLVTPAGC